MCVIIINLCAEFVSSIHMKMETKQGSKMIGKYVDMMQLNIKSISHLQFADDTLILEEKKVLGLCEG